MSAKQLAALKLSVQRNSGLNWSPQRNDNVKMEAEPSPVGLEVLCICNRQLQDILCSSCGFCFVGRVRKKCSVHPNAILLMDSSCCPKCRTVHLIEIRTSCTPTKKPESDGVEEELTMLRQERLSLSSTKSTEQARVHLEDQKLFPKHGDNWESDLQRVQDTSAHNTAGRNMQDDSSRKYQGKSLFGDKENTGSSLREYFERNQVETTVGIHRQTGRMAPNDRQAGSMAPNDRQTVGVASSDRQLGGVSPFTRQAVGISPFDRQTRVKTPADRQIEDEFRVHSSGSVGERFADMYNQGPVGSFGRQHQHTSAQKGLLERRANPFGRQSVYSTAQKQVLDDWEKEQGKMSEMYYGDKRSESETKL